ncbi:hypothetical protein WR25_09547 isoform B [Diploscapter pachys]|uniref:Uncharacterized protein n=1 Tax=Diploscapter pachys TaxID=2018661 RepID=A0A2A2KXD1_9BILA|nr:hypothetical protein WR25_09547 isoform A [Diploscapter pachys]PAV78489.1 hypothetical protein WR25_09547 isoform B [Diploscapter pachys]
MECRWKWTIDERRRRGCEDVVADWHASLCSSTTAFSSILVVKLAESVPPLKWKAHDGLVLCCDWNPISDIIVTGGEDLKFKVWDGYGRILFNSTPHDFPVTAVSWNTDGEMFAVGSHDIMRLCDKAGWSHSLDKLTTGSVLALSWSPDGTQLAAGCAGGNVLHAQVIEKRVTYRNLDVVQTQRNIVEVRDISSEVAREKLETKDRITRISILYDYLVVITTSQMYIYSSKNWNTPSIVELQDKSVSMIVQCDKIFLLSDGNSVLVYNYDGRQLSDIKPPGNGLGLINNRIADLANDCLAVRDRGDSKIIHFLDPINGKPIGDGKITHDQDIAELTISQCRPLNERIVAFRDQSGNIFVALVKTYGNAERIAKIGSMAEQLVFNDVTNMLAGIADNRIIIWPEPSLVFVDQALLRKSLVERQIGSMGKFPTLLYFTGNNIVIRRSDGSIIPTAIPAYGAALLNDISQSKWDQAIRICRHVNDDCLWAILAGLAIFHKNLYASEIAYAALDEYEKVMFLSKARNHPDKDVRNAMLLLLAGRVSEADSILEKSGRIFQSIMLNVKLFRWSRALELAIKNKRYLEIVIGYRQKYLEQFNLKETDPKFLKYQAEMLTKTWIFLLNLSLIFAEKAEPDKAALSELITRLEPTKAEPKSTISITKTPENNASCNWGVSDSGIKLGSDRAYKSLEIKCCDSELEKNVKESIKLGMNTPKLGDAVKFIQRRAQLSLQLPFEVIVSEKNFAIASYYHGSKACKISDGKYFYLIYETPVFYDQLNIKQEEWLASLDSQEPLGSTKTANIRGDLLDIHEFPLAGDDLSVQPPKDSIINQGKSQPGKILDNSIKIQVNDVDIDAITTLDQLMGANGTVSERFRRAGELVSSHSFNEFGTLEIIYDSSRPVENLEEDVGPMPEDRKSDYNWRKQERLPKGTHCNHRMKGGNKCCDGPLSRTIRDALMDLGTSPQFGNPNQEGIIAGRIQKMAQARFDRSFEVIVSQSDFAIASHMIGYNNCKQKFKGYTILTYATPRQYDVEHQAAEDYFFGVSAQEPKGSTDISLPGQKPFHTPLKLEAEGQRQGFPVGSQCGADGLQAGQTYVGQGSSCCNRDIFNAMNQAYDRYINERNFNQYDLRNLARAIQWEVENVMSHSMEVIVSKNDFVFHVHPG